MKTKHETSSASPPIRKRSRNELDALDAAVAVSQGQAVASLGPGGLAVRPDGSPYQPTRQPGEAQRLIDHYVQRLVKLPHAWIAVGANGRAEFGAPALTRLMFEIQERERRDLALNLHDDMGQWLTAIQAEAEAIGASALARHDASARLGAQAIARSATQVQQVIARMLHRLHPDSLTQPNLKDSLRELVAQWRSHYPAIRCTLRLSGRYEDLSQSLRLVLYRVTQEALTNVARHSHARAVSVSMTRGKSGEAGDSVLLTVLDDGIGISAQPHSSGGRHAGLGLIGMRERVIAVDGEFSLKNASPCGLQLQVRVPAKPPPMSRAEQYDERNRFVR